MAERPFIEIHGARENNLKNVSLDILKQSSRCSPLSPVPAKSSLVFDTIAAEAQRQLNETTRATPCSSWSTTRTSWRGGPHRRHGHESGLAWRAGRLRR